MYIYLFSYLREKEIYFETALFRVDNSRLLWNLNEILLQKTKQKKKNSALNFYGPISMSSMLIQIFFDI